jgi:N-acetylneuraminic acid mutarotase
VSYVKAGGKFYLAGGGTAHEMYDPVAKTWSNVAPLPQKLDHIQGVEVGGKIYYVGGLAGFPGPAVGTVYIYDPAANSFTQGAPMPRPRGAGGVAVHQGKIYYAGGLSGGTAVPWLDVYDPAANTWAQLPNMPVARDHFHAAVLGGKFYVTGGRNTAINSTITSTIAYDFASGAWQTGLAPLPTARGGFASAVLGDEVLVIGGEGGGGSFATVEAYNTTTNSWRALAPMPTARHGIQAAVCNGGVYIAAGGKVQGGAGPTNVHERFFLGQPAECTAPGG